MSDTDTNDEGAIPAGDNGEADVVENMVDPRQDGEADVNEDSPADASPTGEADTNEEIPEGKQEGEADNDKPTFSDAPGTASGMSDLSWGQFGKMLHEGFDNLMDQSFGGVAKAHAGDKTADSAPPQIAPAAQPDTQPSPAPAQGAQPDSQTNPQTQGADANNPWGKSAPFIIREAARQGNLDKIPPSVFAAAGMKYDQATKQLIAAPGSGAPNATPGVTPDANDPMNDSPAQHLMPPGPPQPRTFRSVPAKVDPQSRKLVDDMQKQGYNVHDIANRYGWDIFDHAGYNVNMNMPGAPGRPPVKPGWNAYAPRAPHNRDDITGINAHLPTWTLSDKPPTQVPNDSAGPLQYQPGYDPSKAPSANGPNYGLGVGKGAPDVGGGDRGPAPTPPNSAAGVNIIKGGRLTEGPLTGLTPEQQQMMNNFRDKKGNVPPSVAAKIMGMGGAGPQPTVDTKPEHYQAMIRDYHAKEGSYDGIPQSWWKGAQMSPPGGSKVGGDGSPGTGTAQPTNAKAAQGAAALQGIPPGAIQALKSGQITPVAFDRAYGNHGYANPSQYVQ